MKRLVHDKDGVYMIDEDCLRKKELYEKQKEMRWQNKIKPSKNNKKGGSQK